MAIYKYSILLRGLFAIAVCVGTSEVRSENNRMACAEEIGAKDECVPQGERFVKIEQAAYKRCKLTGNPDNNCKDRKGALSGYVQYFSDAKCTIRISRRIPISDQRCDK
jgi:hypothetical protein